MTEMSALLVAMRRRDFHPSRPGANRVVRLSWTLRKRDGEELSAALTFGQRQVPTYLRTGLGALGFVVSSGLRRPCVVCSQNKCMLFLKVRCRTMSVRPRCDQRARNTLQQTDFEWGPSQPHSSPPCTLAAVGYSLPNVGAYKVRTCRLVALCISVDPPLGDN